MYRIFLINLKMKSRSFDEQYILLQDACIKKRTFMNWVEVLVFNCSFNFVDIFSDWWKPHLIAGKGVWMCDFIMT